VLKPQGPLDSGSVHSKTSCGSGASLMEVNDKGFTLDPLLCDPCALIELFFEKLIARQGRNPAPKGLCPCASMLARTSLALSHGWCRRSPKIGSRVCDPCGRQECLPPWRECLRSYICKPANYQPPAMIELVFGRFSPAPNLGHQGTSAFLFKKRVKGLCPLICFFGKRC